MRKDERGYIVVETICSFVLFVLLMVSILSLINIVAVQARIHYAITQAAQTVSMYAYALEITGAAEHLQNSAEKAGEMQGKVDEFKGNLNGLLEGIENLSPSQVYDQGKTLGTQIYDESQNAVKDPKATLQMLMNYGIQEGGNKLFEELVRPLVGRYLANGTWSGDEYLKASHVIDGLKGLSFYDFSLLDHKSMGANDSTLLDADGNVKIVVQYDIDYTFGALMLPFDKLHITQEVKTKAWLSGNGEGYTPEGA